MESSDLYKIDIPEALLEKQKAKAIKQSHETIATRGDYILHQNQ